MHRARERHVVVVRAVRGVEEVQVDAVGIVGSADRRDGFEGEGALAPVAAGRALVEELSELLICGCPIAAGE